MQDASTSGSINQIGSRLESPPQSPYDIRNTEQAGRAVIANAAISVGQLVLKTDPQSSPIAHLIFRTYRREVCAQCFAYNRGREWRIRDKDTYSAFCSEACRQAWVTSCDDIALSAFLVVESSIRTGRRQQKQPHEVAEKDDVKTYQEVDQAWHDARSLVDVIKAARNAHTPTKSQNLQLRKARNLSPDADILSYVLSGILYAYRNHELLLSHQPAESSHNPKTVVPDLYELEDDSRVFFTTLEVSSGLRDYTQSFVLLAAILPIELLGYVTADYVGNLASRASHNAFSIRPEGMTDGGQSGEYLGWGVWPEASYFNHSCRPNLSKSRSGRCWSFCTSRAVSVHEQLCISYLGGDEKEMNVVERRRKLLSTWGFWCNCSQCVNESDV